MTRPAATTTSLPITTPYTPHSNIQVRPSSPLTRTHDKRAETTYIQPSRTAHKKIYSVDDTSRSTQLVAERDTVETSRGHSKRDSMDRGYGGVTSGGRTYHSTSKAPARLTELNTDDAGAYSYTDAASMYRDTEPAWRRPRAGSLERSARPTSMISDRPARTAERERGPPVSSRGFDKINNVPRHHVRSSSIERSREVPKYESYTDIGPTRTSSTRQHAPAIHQEPARDHRRDTYHDTYDRRDVENRRDHLPDPQVAARGFGIAPVNPALAHDYHVPDRQPVYPQEPVHAPVHTRADDYGAPYHSSHRASTHMPDPRMSDPRMADPRASDSRLPDPRASDSRLPDPRVAPRGREAAPPPAAYDNYEKHDKHDKHRDDKHEKKAGFGTAVAGAATGVIGTLAGANYMKNRDKLHDDRNSSEEREREKDRERRRAYDERDSRDKVDDRRERRPEEREERRERKPEERREIPAAPPAYPPRPDAEPRQREARFEDDERAKSSRKAPSSDGSGDERQRHYVDRDAERRREPAPKEAAVDPDEEYRRRIQQEAERTSRSTRDRDHDDTEREHRRRKDHRDSSRSPDDRSRASPPREGTSNRPEERSGSLYDASLVQEPESFDKLQADQPGSKSVTIVTPPKEPQPQVKGILRKPTEKFPEEPEPIREGVAPHKDALKGKDIPVGARWTRIDRRLVNPQALEDAKERFEERMDCVIVLRVLTKSEIQKLADRTKKIRERRGMFADYALSNACTNELTEDEYDEGGRDDREKRSHHSSRDDKDDDERDRDYGHERDRGERRSRRYDDEASDYSDLDRPRERPKELEPAR
jgi:hypothetical protein